MMRDPRRRSAVRQTLLAHRDGLDARLDQVDRPTLVIMGEADSHFDDPVAEGRSIATRTGGVLQTIPDAGHYPHVEFPDQVATVIRDFLAETRL